MFDDPLAANEWSKDENLPSLNNVWGDPSDSQIHVPYQPTIAPDSPVFKPVLNILGPDSDEEDGLLDNTRDATTENANPRLNSNKKGKNKNAQNKNEEDIIDIADWAETFRKDYHPLSMDSVSIRQVSEREGMLFKHTNWELTYTSPSSQTFIVIRRYSDFVWLKEILIERYPFRMIPELPPKRIGSQNTDELFLKKRMKGLSRFINLLLKHPFLNKDGMVQKFITLKVDLSSWRKNAKISTTDEFQNRRISNNFMKIWVKDFAIQWNEADASIENMIETWSKIGALIERQERRLRQIQQESNNFDELLTDLIHYTPKLYNNEQNKGTVLDINNHLSIVKQTFKENSTIMNTELDKFSKSVITKFKIFIDMLISLRKLFERYRIMAGNNIGQLHKHIEANLAKMEQEKGKADSSSAEYDKLKLAIQGDRREIYQQTNRAWLIRECVLQEFSLFQETQYLITEAFKSWVRIRSNTAGLDLNLWEKLVDNLEDMPTRI